MKSLKQTIMDRDNLTDVEAKEKINEAKDAMYEYLENDDLEAAHNICEEYFGLEPDYLFELID